MFSENEQKGDECRGNTHPEPNTKLQTVKCFLFILDSCKMEQHPPLQIQGGGTGPPAHSGEVA